MYNTSRVYVQHFTRFVQHFTYFWLKYNVNITAFICVFKVCLIETDVLSG